jgi:hypothetical protein
MRVTVGELDNGKVYFTFSRDNFSIYNEMLYKTVGKNQPTKVGKDSLTKLTNTVYKDNYGFFYLTEEHPFFNAAVLYSSCVTYRVANSLKISKLLEDIAHNVKLSFLDASRSYNERQTK